MNKNKRKVAFVVVLIAVVAVSIIGYQFNMPHRDVESASVDKKILATALVNEFLVDQGAANDTYLADNGESKILIVYGKIAKIGEDQQGMKTILLKDEGEKMGVSCTFTLESNEQVSFLKIGQNTSVKGVIRAGAEYDEDLDLAEDAILEKCSVVND